MLLSPRSRSLLQLHQFVADLPYIHLPFNSIFQFNLIYIVPNHQGRRPYIKFQLQPVKSFSRVLVDSSRLSCGLFFSGFF